MNCEVKYKKVSVNSLVPKPHIVMRSPEGTLVQMKRVTLNGDMLEGFHWKFFTEDGEEIESKTIEYFEVQKDGKEQQVRPFDRTKIIRIVKEVPAASMSGFLIDSVYELFSVDDSSVDSLYQEAERYLKNDLVGIALFSWGRGFKQYYAIVFPIVRDGKFVWIMRLTQTKEEYQHLMEIPATKELVAQPPTLKKLPPVEALIVQ